MFHANSADPNLGVLDKLSILLGYLVYDQWLLNTYGLYADDFGG